MLRFLLLIIFYFLLCLHEKNAAETLLDHSIDDPDYPKDLSEYITCNGYPFEEYTVQTADGYLLSVQRIPHGRKSNVEVNKKGVVLLVHGSFIDSSVWFLKSRDQSLGFILPDEGYDAWFINTRGTTYSKKHIKYNTNQYQFWDFSFDEVAQYDIPATIDCILKNTAEKDLYLIGASAGTTASFAMLSEMPDYNKKVKLFIALEPVVFVGHTTSAARVVAPFADEIAFIIDLISSGEIPPDIKFTRALVEKFCTAFQELCNLIFALAGVGAYKLNKTECPANPAQYISGTSTKTVVHQTQLVKSKKFRKYDYGFRNMKYYKQEEPPDYVLSRITTPVALISSKNDKIADVKDVDILRRKLKSLVFDYTVPEPASHSDVFLSDDVTINEPILKLLPQY